MTDIADRVKKIVSDHLGAELEKVTDDALLVPDHDDQARKIDSGKPDLGADSLDVIELVMALEEEFDIEITPDESEPLNTGTVKDLVDLVESKAAGLA